MNPIFTSALVTALFAGTMACSMPPADSPSAAPPGSVPPPTTVPQSRTVAGQSHQGRPIEALVLGNGTETILVLATIHGNEPAGRELVNRFRAHLLTHPGLLDGRTVVLVPVANPDGLARGTRANAAGIDLNRNFPTGNYRPSRGHGQTPLSEPESRALYDLIVQHTPTRVVSIHQPLGLMDWDGPGRGLASRMAASCGLPLRKLGARPGSLGSWVGIKLKRPIITMEMPGGRTDPERDWERYGGALLIAVAGELNP